MSASYIGYLTHGKDNGETRGTRRLQNNINIGKNMEKSRVRRGKSQTRPNSNAPGETSPVISVD